MGWRSPTLPTLLRLALVVLALGTGCRARRGEPLRVRVVDLVGQPGTGAVVYAENFRRGEPVAFGWARTGEDVWTVKEASGAKNGGVLAAFARAYRALGDPGQVVLPREEDKRRVLEQAIVRYGTGGGPGR